MEPDNTIPQPETKEELKISKKALKRKKKLEDWARAKLEKKVSSDTIT